MKNKNQKKNQSPRSRASAERSAASMRESFCAMGAKGIALDVVFPAILFLLTLGIIAYYIIYPSEGYLHSDCTDTILWARASYETGKWITPDFNYAAILPFGGNLLMLVFMPFFGYSMTTHTLGMLLFAVLFVFSAVFFCRRLKMSNLGASAFIFVLCFILSASDKLREIMWGHIIYYSLGILFFMLGFGILFSITDAQKKSEGEAQMLWRVLGGRRGVIYHVILFVLCALTATNGTQSLLTFLLPLMGAIVLLCVFDGEREGFLQRCVTSGVTLVTAFVGTAFGFILMNKIVGEVNSGYATAFSSYSAMAEWVDNLLKFPIHYLELLGVEVAQYDPLVSLGSFVTMARIFGGIAILILPVVLAVRAHKKNDQNKKLLVYGHFLLCAMLMYAYVFGLLNSANWRLVPMLGTSVITSVVAVLDMLSDKEKPVAKRVGALLLSLIILLSSICCAEIIKMPADYGRDNSLHLLTERLVALKEEGVINEKGYATFWNSQAVTLLSDDEITLRGMSVGATPTPYDYQQFYSWFDESADGCYLVLSDYERYQLSYWFMGEGAGYTYHENYNGYNIFVYEKDILAN